MRFLFNYKGINKIMLTAESYEDIIKFIKNNFFLKMSKWEMHYIDSDGDQITLDSELDFQTMLETTGKDHIKIYIKDKECQEEIHVGQQINVATETEPLVKVVEKTQETAQEPIKTVQIQNTVQKSQTKPTEVQENVSEEKKMEEGKPEEMNQGWGWGKCHGGRGMWKKRMQEKMATFIDARIQTLMPCIIKKVQEKLKNVEPMPAKTEGVKHDVKCNGCGTEFIFGIRYKCVKCPVFNLCETCETQIQHDHNMIKMKKIEEIQEVKPQFFGRPPMPMGHHPFFPNPSFNMPPPPPVPMGARMGEPRFEFGCPPRFNPFMVPSFEGAEKNLDVKEKKDKSCERDPRLKVTKKCFKMTKFFGGSPQNYQEFVMKNKDLRVDELCKLYKELNVNAEMSEQINEKAEQKIEKLAFYYKQSPQQFKEIVNANPAANLRQLIKTIEEKKKVSEVQKPECKVEQVEEKKQKIQQKSSIKVQQKAPILDAKKLEPPTISVPLRRPLDIKKRNEFVLEMKELLGGEKVFEFINFFNENYELEKTQLVDLYFKRYC